MLFRSPVSAAVRPLCRFFAGNGNPARTEWQTALRAGFAGVWGAANPPWDRAEAEGKIVQDKAVASPPFTSARSAGRECDENADDAVWQIWHEK